MIDNPGNKEDWEDQPIVFPSPADGKSINSFVSRTPPSRTKPGQRKPGKNYDSQNDLRCGAPQNIQLAKMDRVEQSNHRYPPSRKVNTCFMAQIVNGNHFFLQMRLTTADGQNTADALIFRSMLALLARQKTGKRLKNKSNCTNLVERRAAQRLGTQPVPFGNVRTKFNNKTRPTHIAGIRIRQKLYLRGGPSDWFAAQTKEIISPKIKFLYCFMRESHLAAKAMNAIKDCVQGPGVQMRNWT